jgi:hypothetical protein
MITDRDLIQMGFKRTDETIKSSNEEVDKWYYTFEIGDLTFVTNPSNEITDENPFWSVRLFGSNTINITRCTDVGECIEVLTRLTKV